MTYYILGATIFVVALVVSVMFHEAGHLLTAKAFGMKATQFFVGFGPTLWSRRRGETEYGVKAIPAGGFVKIVGMAPEEKIDPADEPRAFHRQAAWKRTVVLVAGSVAHFVIAFALLFGIAVGLGVPGKVTTTLTIDSVSPCVPASQQAPCAASDPASPARQVGLRPGDRIVEFAGKPVQSWEQLSQALRAHGPGQVSMVVVRDGRRLELSPTLAAAPKPAANGAPSGFIGVIPVQHRESQRLGPLAAVSYTGRVFGDSVIGMGQVLKGLPTAIPSLFSRDRGATAGSSGMSVIGAARVSGEILTAAPSWIDRTRGFLLLVATLNISVGVFNLLPLLPLDGGRLALVGYERLRVLTARLRGRTDPGPLDLTRVMPALYAGFVLLLGLGVLLIVADIVNPLSIR